MELAILLVALAAAAARPDREICQREMSQQSLHKCRSFLRSGSKEEGMRMDLNDEGDDSDSTMAPRMCCEQLEDVKRECRCDAIKNVMQQMMEEEGQQESSGRCGEMMMRAKLLPAMCNMAPHTCKIRRGGRGIGMVV